jgi:hypothetical protein
MIQQDMVSVKGFSGRPVKTFFIASLTQLSSTLNIAIWPLLHAILDGDHDYGVWVIAEVISLVKFDRSKIISGSPGLLDAESIFTQPDYFLPG